jgi:hypothetical protein
MLEGNRDGEEIDCVILEGNRDGGEIEPGLNGLNPVTDMYVLRLALSIELIVRRLPRALSISELSKGNDEASRKPELWRRNLPKTAPSDYYLATLFYL